MFYVTYCSLLVSCFYSPTHSSILPILFIISTITYLSSLQLQTYSLTTPHHDISFYTSLLLLYDRLSSICILYNLYKYIFSSYTYIFYFINLLKFSWSRFLFICVFSYILHTSSLLPVSSYIYFYLKSPVLAAAPDIPQPAF